jgi:thioredoxin-like negative regulator of GroEL
MQQPLPKAQPINVAQVFAQALNLHQQGRLSEAELLYSAILAARPDHVDTLQMMGLFKLAKGQPGEALRLVSAAMHGRKPAADAAQPRPHPQRAGTFGISRT